MIAVVIPTYNEAASIAELIEALAPTGAHIIVVDDASPDRTGPIARDCGAEVLARPGKGGLASAYVAGLGHALDQGFDPIIQMDADLSHDPADVPRLTGALQDAELVLGSRYVAGGGTENWSLWRRGLSRFGSLYARQWLSLPYRDLTGGFKAWRAQTLGRIDLGTVRSEGYAFQVETTLRAHRLGASITELPITFTERTEGRSKMTRAIAIEAALVIPRLR